MEDCWDSKKRYSSDQSSSSQALIPGEERDILSPRKECEITGRFVLVCLCVLFCHPRITKEIEIATLQGWNLRFKGFGKVHLWSHPKSEIFLVCFSLLIFLMFPTTEETVKPVHRKIHSVSLQMLPSPLARTCSGVLSIQCHYSERGDDIGGLMSLQNIDILCINAECYSVLITYFSWKLIHKLLFDR